MGKSNILPTGYCWGPVFLVDCGVLVLKVNMVLVWDCVEQARFCSSCEETFTVSICWNWGVPLRLVRLSSVRRTTDGWWMKCNFFLASTLWIWTLLMLFSPDTVIFLSELLMIHYITNVSLEKTSRFIRLLMLR